MFRATNAKSRSRLALTSAIAAATLALSGCATTVNDFKEAASADVSIEADNTLRSVTSSWSATPGTQVLQHRNGEGITIHGPVDIPSRIGNKTVSLAFPGTVTIRDLVEALALEGVNLIPVSGNQSMPQNIVPAAPSGSAAPAGQGDAAASPESPDEQFVSAIQGATASMLAPQATSGPDVSQKTFQLPRFEGTVAELLEVVSMMTDVSFRGSGNYILARNGIEYYVDLPQDESLVNRIARDLSALGATNVVTSIDAGSVTFQAGASRDHVLRDYMERLERNNAMIGLQVAVVSVAHDRDRNTGIDWSALQATVGGASLESPSSDNGNGGTPEGGSQADNGDNGSDAGSVVVDAANRISGVATGNALSLAYLGGDFELRGLINMLSSYGATETKQNLVLRTLSANPVKIRSGQSTPYVSEINVSSTGGDSLTGGTETDVAETGLTLGITPYYNDKTGLVTMTVDLEMSSIIAFINLSAGSQVGTLTQPDIQEQSFSNAARLMAGETVILGGLTYDQISTDGNTLSPIESLELDGEKYSRQQNSLFVVLRPTVTIYE